MGVHDLWSIVEPVRESVPLYSLSGKTLAVDLSLWVCEAQHVQAMMGRVTKPHLRNLFFRVSSLTLMGIKLVFVMEGEAPKLKAETMKKRTEKRFGVKKTEAAKGPTNTSRGRFKAVLRECAEMLDYLGVPWVTAAGEAEAMCAFLDSQGLVDGCITNDGDAFLYGARTVYRNFNMNSKDPQVDCYRTARVQSELRLCRENLVGLAILLGCDFIPKGIPGVGKEQALKMIQTLKGKTLLQKFNQWREDNAVVSEGHVKKLPHCHICRHPGSAKTHERGGCVLCNSKRFCQPQDFDYKCPCDWHQYESSRQALTLETNIRKKTLASQQFPFSEIIHEFLITKDSSTCHFKRRRPNMLLMQKFAFDKMEWPKHYTSEKVLVLMTYTEMMNRNYGRDSSSQIKPLGIVKPRVRNAVACFEVLWSPPEHYVFPEDHPAENQQEVRTIEEESLFRVAFPELVERYLKDKTLAEENKTKKKKTKSKKEKASDVSEGISDLLAQMSLQTSSSSTNATQTHTLLPEILHTEKTTGNQKLHLNAHEELHSLASSPNTPVPRGDSADVASPSVSAVIDALHLSDIDWEAVSFTSSPPPLTAANQATGPKLQETSEERNMERNTSTGVTEADPRSAPEPCYTNCPLRDRVLMKNAARSMTQKDDASVDPKPSNYELPSVRHVPPCDANLKSKGHMSSNQDSKATGKKSDDNKHKPIRKPSQPPSLPAVKGQWKAKVQWSESQKPQHQYRFVRTASLSSAVPTERSRSDPGPADSDTAAKSTKKSVCMNLCSSSEDSDTENHQRGPRRAAAAIPRSETEAGVRADVSLETASSHKTSKPRSKAARCPQPLGPAPQNHSADVERSSTSGATRSRRQDVERDALLGSPASPVAAADSDDSLICCDSPLPLAERLRLKFQK